MSVLQQLLEELQQTKAAAATGTPAGPSAHGPSGLFGVPGLERDVISSRMNPQGLASAIPAKPTVTMFPLFPYVTGYTAPTGTQPTTDCADGQVAGSMKTVLQTAEFGLTKFKTRELNIALQGDLVNRGEFTDLRFVNDPLGVEMAGFIPNVPYERALEYGREVLTRFVDVGVAFQDYHLQKIWTGTGSSNEYPGLEYLVVENHYDAKTGQLAPALQSDIRDFGNVDVTTAAGAASIVTVLVDMFRHAKYNATRMRFAPVEFAFVMKEQLFNELADVWPCSYLTNRCVTATDAKTVFVDAQSQIDMRVQMRQGQYLLIDDVPVRVITDDGLVETEINNTTLTYQSDIYLLPMTVRGGRPVLFWEFFDYSKGSAPAIADGRANDIFWTDRGVYLWARQTTYNTCVIWQSETRMRVILETPQLAGRLQNVRYSVSKHLRDAIVGQDYYLDGGNTGYTADTLYNTWDNVPA